MSLLCKMKLMEKQVLIAKENAASVKYKEYFLNKPNDCITI